MSKHAIGLHNADPEFKFFIEQFADLKILRYQIPGFENLSLAQKELLFYLSEAALCGRDIIFDQNGKYNLLIRRVLENIYLSYSGNRESDDWKDFVVYLKRVWFSNGIYHHYASDKIKPDFSYEYFDGLVRNSNQVGFPLDNGQNIDNLLIELRKVIFDPDFLPKKVCLDSGKDLVKSSAVNFYENVSQQEVEDFYQAIEQTDAARPQSSGLNSSIVKENGILKEQVWKIGGKYSKPIEKIVYWLEKASLIAENELQKASLEKLIAYYKTGDLQLWDEYNILWVNDVHSLIDVVNGFIETYEDPLGRKASWESVVNFKDIQATKRVEIISNNAQWFEDNSPVDTRFKKESVKGVTAKVITVVQLAGDCYPTPPIGINLPNADWIRKEHGSKSVSIQNITYAYEKASFGNGMLEEFVNSEEECELARKYGPLASNLHTDLHECLGHGSGQLLPGISTDALKSYQSTLEETRADLFALYYIMDPKLIELQVIPDIKVAIAEYNSFIRNGLLTQLVRIEHGKNIEESHMRNRQLIAKWCYEKGKAENVIEIFNDNNKTFVRINDYNKLRLLFAELLAEVQRIKSEGDFEAGKLLVENYGVKVDPILHNEILTRFKALNIAPYSGFLNPRLVAVENEGKIIDVKIEYLDDFTKQMLYYAKNYSFLPSW